MCLCGQRLPISAVAAAYSYFENGCIKILSKIFLSLWACMGLCIFRRLNTFFQGNRKLPGNYMLGLKVWNIIMSSDQIYYGCIMVEVPLELWLNRLTTG